MYGNFEVRFSFSIRQRIDHLNAHKTTHPLAADVDVVGGLHIVKPIVLRKLRADPVGGHGLLRVIVAPSCVSFINRLGAGFTVGFEADIALRLQKLDHIVAAAFDRLHIFSGLTGNAGMVDALDSAEFAGSLIILLNEGVSFVKRNMKTRWKKTADSRVEMPDYCERSVFEALVNALIHRDYLILGSEVHIDIYDDRLTIYSPGGMADGTRIQERDLSSISSTRRNPVLADIFGRLGYMERQGSGFKKITETYRAAHNYRDELEPKFYSDASSFQVTLYNLNYGTAATASKVTIEGENVAIEVAIDRLNASQGTIAKAKAVFANMGVDGVFGRSDIAAITKDSVTAAGNLIAKLKNADLIEPVSGFGKGKYKFIAPKE